MNETTRLLEQMAERSDDLHLASGAAVRARGGQLTRRRWAAWGVAVALVVASVTTWSLASRPAADPRPVKPPQQVILPQRVNAPDGPPTWTTHLPGNGDFWVRAVAYHAGTWLALGETPDRQHSLGWVSQDGRHWVPETVPEGLGHGIDSVTATPTGFAAVGRIGRQQLVWTIRDGTTWAQPVPLPQPDRFSVMYAYQPFWTSKGLFVIGAASAYGSYLWRSSDEGRHWNAVADVAAFRDGPGCDHNPALAEALEWISEKDGTLVAGGSCARWRDNTPRRALTYRSTDGEHWTQTARPYRNDREPVIWEQWERPMLSTGDPLHFARADDHGTVRVWRTPPE